MDSRTASSAIQLRELIDRMLSRLNTCLPGEIQSFDAATQTAKVVPGVKLRTYIDDKVGHLEMPEIVNAPVVFPFASQAGFALTLPIRKGDPCLILFAQRAIENWHQLGGFQPPEEGLGSRHHDLTDAVVLMAPSPLPGVLGAWEASGLELRNRARNSRVTVRDSEVEIQVGTATLKVSSDGKVEATAPAGAKITAPLTEVVGNLTVSGTAVVAGALSSATSVADPTGTMQKMRTTYNTHTHPENGSGGGTTSAPNQGMT